MMFRSISYRIALQFTAFVFCLVLVNGIAFLAADFQNARRQSDQRLARTMQMVTQHFHGDMLTLPRLLPPPLRDRVRLLRADGQPLYSGEFFRDVAFDPNEGMHELILENEQYRLLTARVTEDQQLVGYIQVADVERLQRSDLPERALLYLVVSVIISAVTFLVGLSFARRSLKPAEDMVERLEQFTQDASHELRTPIAAVQSSLDLALRKETYREGILSAKEDLRQVSGLVERLLELARLDTGILERDTVDLSGLVQDTVTKQRTQAAQEHVHLVGNVQPGVTVQGDAALIRQLLLNLVSNSIKYRKSGGGTITVSLTPHYMQVADDGAGIAPVDLPHIFDRFYQADAARSRGGFGLGLSFVKRVVDLHGWTLDVKSKQGEGTTFIVRF